MRYEQKFFTHQITFRQCEQLVRLHPALFKKTYPDRWVNNIYLDSPDLKSFYENIHGISERIKYRIRWYGCEGQWMRNPVLEVKIKKNTLGEKRRIKVEDFKLPELKRRLIQAASEGWAPKQYLPSVFNKYLRSYYQSDDGIFRITLDRNLSYSHFMLGNSQPQHGLPGIIIELKYDEMYDELSDRIRRYIPFRQTKSSKYVEGILRWLI